jgi:hypothetical protein
MIEPLESRALFSVTPHAALITLRSDLAGVGQTINSMIVANKAAVANLQSDMSIFPTHLTSDHAALQELNFQFRAGAAALSNDFNNIKLLLSQDISQLILDTNGYNRHPTAGAGQVVQAEQQLIISEGNAASFTLTQDASLLQMGYQNVLQLIAVSHPLDATLTTRVSHISTALSANTTAIHNTANAVAMSDVPNFSTALEPAGVITS